MYLAQQPTQSTDFLSKAQATHPFKFCCAYKIVKKERFHMRFLIKKVLHDIFKGNKNMIKKLLRTPKLEPLLEPLLHSGQNDKERTWKKIIKATNVNKRFKPFQK